MLNVMASARSIGLVGDNGADVLGTIEQNVVLDALDELALFHPSASELFDQASEKVRRSRSAGVERPERNSVLARDRSVEEIQLRYRNEMANIFIDLAIDLGLRDNNNEVATASG
jgi:hypothetical protein